MCCQAADSPTTVGELLLLFFSEVFDAGAVVKRENQVMQVALRQKPVFGGSKTSGVCLLTEDHAYL